MTCMPFLGTEARADGRVTKRTLRSRHTMVYRNVYVPKGQEVTPAMRAVAAWLWADRAAVVAGMSAAAMHGSKWIDPRLSAELNRHDACTVDGIRVHREVLRPGETCEVRGVPVTSPARTAFDLGRRPGRDRAVVRLDALAQATGLQAADIAPLVECHRGVRGLVQLRDVLELMDGGAESPQDTRTRLVLVDAGLPRPQTQIVVCGRFSGRRSARIDMGYEEFKVGIEYDGEQHWTDPAQRAYDIDRYAELAVRGWVLIRVSAELLRCRPQVIVERVCAALRAAGCPWLGECGSEARFSA